MSKLICDICGTSYPDTATQCPICGCVRQAESTAVTDSDPENRGYTYVKGGRFSKSNVRKRNNAHRGVKFSSNAKGEKQAPSKKVIALVIVVALLFLIVSCMVGFIVITLTGDGGLNWFGDKDTVQTDPAEIPCTGITLSKSSLSFQSVGEEFTLSTICAPMNTTDEITFSSSDASVVTVSEEGKVVCVGAGEAVIYVYCGEQVDECLVKCDLEEIEPPTETEASVSVKLSRENITDAKFPGYSWELYESGDVPAEELTWTSEDPTVATVDAKGVVKAVAEGSTVIRVYYNDQEVASCSITCDFSQQEELPEEVSGNYAPYVPVYGLFLPFEKGRDCYSATLRLNEWIDIVLRDPENPQNEVKVIWSIVEGDCRVDSDGGGITATSERQCKIKAEYSGQTFYILIY